MFVNTHRAIKYLSQCLTYNDMFTVKTPDKCNDNVHAITLDFKLLNPL